LLLFAIVISIREFFDGRIENFIASADGDTSPNSINLLSDSILIIRGG